MRCFKQSDDDGRRELALFVEGTAANVVRMVNSIREAKAFPMTVRVEVLPRER